MSSPTFYHNIIHLLLHSSPPLAFWAGDSSPILVSAHFLSKWTVLVYPTTANSAEKNDSLRRSNKGKGKEIVPEEEASESASRDRSESVEEAEVEVAEAEAEVGEGKRVFPLLWIDMTGRILSELWEAALCYVKEDLLVHSGATVVSFSFLSSALDSIRRLRLVLILSDVSTETNDDSIPSIWKKFDLA